MAVVYFYEELVIQTGGQRVTAGRFSNPLNFSIDGDVSDKEFSVADGTSVLAWDFSTSRIDSFKVLRIESSVDVYVEFEVDSEDDVGRQFYVIQVRGSFPLTLFSDFGSALHVGEFGDLPMNLDKIEKIRILNDGEVAAKIRIIVAK